MKIGVVTVHDSANFGSFLQAYAMNEVLAEMGHDAYFLQTRDKKYVKSLFYSFRIYRETIKHPIEFIRRNFFGIKKYRLFTEEQKCFRESYSYSELKPDAVILGSDEIWNVKTPVFTKGIFYGEGMKNVLTYAVSIGLSETADVTAHKNIAAMIGNMKGILARDDKTADCVETITGKRPDIVCDPTFLIPMEKYNKPYHNKYIEENKYILVYTYALDKKIQRILRDFAIEHGLKLVSVCFYYDWCDRSIICSPLDFCKVLKNAQYVITTTFHGTVFSILNHKRFVSVPLSPKTSDIMHRTGLSDAIVSFPELSVKMLDDKLKNAAFDYDAVEEKIQAIRTKSLKLLKKSIEVYNNGNM